MAADLDFAAFRRRLDPTRRDADAHYTFHIDNLANVCRWASDAERYCFAKNPGDTPELVDFFTFNPGVECLEDFPSKSIPLLDQAFCEPHAQSARLYLDKKRSIKTEDGVLIKYERDDDRKHGEAPRLLTLSFGTDDLMHFKFHPASMFHEDLHLKPDSETRTIKLETPDGRIVSPLEDPSEHPGYSGEACDPSESDSDANDGAAHEAPSTASKRLQKAERTFEHDRMHSKKIAFHEQAVTKEITSDLHRWTKKPGYVYAIRDPELKLIKIGSAQSIATRVGAIQSACKPGKPLEIVAGLGEKSLWAYRRLEKLVLLDLRPHRWYFRCLCGPVGDTRHQEWFDVSDEVAIETLKVWRDFILHDPYGKQLVETGYYPLLKPWPAKIDDRPRPKKDEQHDDHEVRLTRWAKLFGRTEKEIRNAIFRIKGALEDTKSETHDATAKLDSTPFTIDEDAIRGIQREPRQSGSQAGNTFASLGHRTSNPFAFDPVVKKESDGSNPLSSHMWKVPAFGSPSTAPPSKISPWNTPASSAPSQARAINEAPTHSNTNTTSASKATLGSNLQSGGKTLVKSKSHSDLQNPSTPLPLTFGAQKGTPESLPKKSPSPDSTFVRSPAPSQKLLKPMRGHVRSQSAALEVPATNALVSSTQPKGDGTSTLARPTSTNANSETAASYQSQDGGRLAMRPNEPATDTSLATLRRDFQKLLTSPRPDVGKLPPRSILDDLIHFRWPLVYALTFSVYSSYVPPGLSLITWIVFLPFLVGELRMWFPPTDQWLATTPGIS